MAKLTTEDLLTREGRITFLAAVIAGDTDLTIGIPGGGPYTFEERMRALEMLMSVEGDQVVHSPAAVADEYDDEDCEACEGCDVCEGYEDDGDCCPEHEDVSKL